MHTKRARCAVAVLAASATAVVTLTAPQGIAAASCVMTVNAKTLRTVTYRSGVVWKQIQVRATNARSSQSAIVQVMTMPAKARPKLVYQRLGWLDELRDQVKAQTPRAVAAVNGGFFFEYRFATGGSAILPRDAEVSKGTVVRAGSTPTPVLGLDTAGKPYAGTLSVSGSVSGPAATVPLTGVNWQSVSARGAVVFTTAWADSGARRPAGAVEWVLGSNNRILDVRTKGGRGAPVAAGTRVVAFGTNVVSQAQRGRVGDLVTVDVQQLTSTSQSLREAVGRGVPLVKDRSVVIDCTSHSPEQRPRTTIGWNARGRWMTLTVPGTGYDSSGYRIGGLGLGAEAAVAKALGLANAYEVDGGGSVTSYVRRNSGVWDRLDDKDSQWQRPITNGLAFMTR